MFKRLFDITCSIVILSLTSPLLALIGLLIRLDSPGPALYRSPRVGRGGKYFGMLRFRTMEDIQLPPRSNHRLRETRVGHVIRNYSVDDLPNLWNVLQGDMSIVGPRPTEPHIVEQNPEWRRILSVRPGWVGNAGLSLASSFNSSSPSLKRQLELEYVENHSLALDLCLMRRAICGYFT